MEATSRLRTQYLGPEIGYTFCMYVQDTRLFGTKEPLVTPFTVAVIVDNVNWPSQRDCGTRTDVLIAESVSVNLVYHERLWL